MRLVSLAAISALLATPAFSCACCGEHGARIDTTYEIADWFEQSLQNVELGSDAYLFVDACGFDCVRGIAELAERYSLIAQTSATGMVLQLSPETGGPSGTLRFDWPTQISHFATDIAPFSDTLDPQLFTEMRLGATATGEGIFEAANGADLLLVFSGMANLCAEPDMLDYWSLEVTGPDAGFRLYGRQPMG